MVAMGSRLDHLDGAISAESRRRLEILVLEAFRRAAGGETFSVTPVLAHAEALVALGQHGQALDVLETAARFRHCLTGQDYNLLRLTTVNRMLEMGDYSQRPLGLLEGLLGEPALDTDMRAQALLCLSQIRASSGDYASAADVLDPKQSMTPQRAYDRSDVVLAHATYLNLVPDSSSALDVVKQYVDTLSSSNTHELCQGLLQQAWALTNAGSFQESDNVLRTPVLQQRGYANVLTYIRAWNAVGATGGGFDEAIRVGSQLIDVDSESGVWTDKFFAAWSAVASGKLRDAQDLFNLLSTDHTIEPTLNGTREQLALRGRAYTALAMKDYDSAFDAFRILCTSVPSRPAATKFTSIIDACAYGRLATKLNSISVVEVVSSARRCAHISLGSASLFVPRLMDFEAELLLAANRGEEARATRTLALELMDEGVESNETDRLAHQLGLCLVDVQEKSALALEGLRSVLPSLHQKFGRNHEKTVVARYALASLAATDGSLSGEAADFEELHRDLVSVFGLDHPLTLKSRYGIARDLQRRNLISEALKVYIEVDGLLSVPPQNNTFAVSVQRRIGECQRGLNRYAAAHHAFENALKIHESSVSPAPQRRFEIELDLNESLVKTGVYRGPMQYFADKAAQLRRSKMEMTTEYFRSVQGYASCLEHLGNYHGAAHNYGHLVRLLENGMFSDDLEKRREIFLASAWNNEMSKNFLNAVDLYEKALLAMQMLEGEGTSKRSITDVEFRLDCCRAALS